MTDWVPELADDDLDVLLEALEAWETKDIAGHMMTDLLDGMLGGRDPSVRATLAIQREKEKEERERDKRLRKERSVLLRAKLITIRDRRHAEQMTADALKVDR